MTAFIGANADMDWSFNSVKIEPVKWAIFHNPLRDLQGAGARTKKIGSSPASQADWFSFGVQLIGRMLVKRRTNSFVDMTNKIGAREPVGELDGTKNLPDWIEKLKENTDEGIVTILLGNKVDLVDKRIID